MLVKHINIVEKFLISFTIKATIKSLSSYAKVNVQYEIAKNEINNPLKKYLNIIFNTFKSTFTEKIVLEIDKTKLKKNLLSLTINNI